MMEPLKITFELGSAICLPKYPLHLDALIAYINTQKGLITLEEPHSRKALLALADDLPFERHGDGEDWIYKASALQPVGDLKHSSRFYTNRHDKASIASAVKNNQIQLKRQAASLEKMTHAGQLDFNRGHQRNALVYHNITYVDKMEAYCIGDKLLLEEALSSGHLTHLGKLHRMGFGFIKQVEIKVCSEANELWKQRVKPFEEKGDMSVSSPLRPPYWDIGTKTLCFMPVNLI
ncbi:type IV CRISPR-associated protein Csf3 (plasmid) [Alteromonas macleodii]|uniref:type IV CRISPR-associated protein Csf3 n=1 Tax=Alteromonas macleodii TaxID=28108 RepID=UPI0030D1B09C